MYTSELDFFYIWKKHRCCFVSYSLNNPCMYDTNLLREILTFLLNLIEFIS